MAVILGQDGDFPTYFLMESQTFVPPRNGNVTVHVIGGGGSGAAGQNQTEHGGSGAGYCQKTTLAVTTAGSFTVVVGAGGLGTQGQVGLAGGNSTCAGTGLSATLTANGGGGGPKQNAQRNTGGTASNGDVNRTGGGTGRMSGGGAVGINANGQFASADGGTSGAYGFAGQCETLGDFWNGTRLGKIYGERRGYSGNTGGVTITLAGPSLDSGPLSGGAFAHQTANSVTTGVMVGGAGGNPGGGGGEAHNGSQAARTFGGEGGGGMVIFSYKP